MIFCKECGSSNPEGSNYCSQCGLSLFNIDKIIKRYKDEAKNREIKNVKFRNLYGDIGDAPAEDDDKRYTSARLKDRTRRLFDGYKIVNQIKFDNDAVFALLRDWIDNPNTKTSEVNKLDDVVRMYLDRDSDLVEG